MCSGHRHKFHHFHDSGGSLFHFLTEFSIPFFHDIPESDHGDGCYRCGQKEKDKYDPALADGDHQRHTNIQRNVQNA